MKKLVILVIVSFAASVVFGSANNEVLSEGHKVKSIIVYNAASTTDVISDIAKLFTEETGILVNTNPAASGTLARQIEQGAEVDVYISASKKWITYISDLELIEKKSVFVTNSLALVSPVDSLIEPFDISDNIKLPLIFSGRLSMGDPEFVPAGAYARDALKYYGWYSELEDRLLLAVNVRAALSVVELDEVDLGIVYSSDAKKSDKVKIISVFPEESHIPVEYYCSVVKDSSKEGELFYNFLLENKDALELYVKYGFKPAN